VSPFLSILALTLKGSPGFASLLMYADDGIFYSSKKFSAEDVRRWFSGLGLPLSEDKCCWVRENYAWARPLKFLGMSFDGSSYRAATRKGASLVYDKADLVK